MNSIAKAVGLNNLKGKKRPKNEDVDLEVEEDETEATEDAGSIEVEDGVDETAADEVADEAIEEAKDEAARTIEEVAPAAVKKPANPAPKEDENMKKFNLEFWDNFRNKAYESLFGDGDVAPEVLDFIEAIARKSEKVRDKVTAIKAELDYQPPAWGWRYKAVGCLKGQIFDSKAAAEEAAEDLMNLGGKKFNELFIKAPYYINEDGKFSKKVPEKSRDYQIIMASEAPANAEA